MMTLALLALSPAHADQLAPADAPCGVWLSARFPMADAEDVPVDIAPAYLVESCGGMDHEAMVRVTSEDGSVAFTEVLNLPAPSVFSGAQPVDLPQLELEPNTVYTVAVESQDYMGSWSFTTGDRLAAPPIQAPVLVLDEAAGWITADGFESNIYGSVTPENTFVRLVSDELAVPVAFTLGYVAFGMVHAEQEVCFTPEVRGEGGTWLAGDEKCILSEELEEPDFNRGVGPFGWLGCSSSGAAGLFLGPLPLLLLRRRRS